MAIQLRIGLDAITSYRRLAYTAWYAIAEFVDNSTQSFFDNRAELEAAYVKEGEGLTVSITYDKDAGVLRIADNAMGMSYDELDAALHVARPPKHTNGRSKYGMGLKTAACWIGNEWSVTTKKLGETVEHKVTVKVSDVASGKAELPDSHVEGKAASLHYTILEIRDLNQQFRTRTISKIREFLGSMYREDFRNGILTLTWNGPKLTWEEVDTRLLKSETGNVYKKDFSFSIGGKTIKGWVGILDRGSRRDAGFSILHSGRVVRGQPDAWRPQTIYGQYQGSNDLINQRLVGEVHMDDFDVSHTKDGILWGEYEDEIEDKLLEVCADYREFAQKYRKKADTRGPSEEEINVAVDQLQHELSSPEMVDQIKIETVPSEETVMHYKQHLTDHVTKKYKAKFSAKIADLSVRGFLPADISPTEPYVTVESTSPNEVIVIVNAVHPHWGELKGSEGVLNYLRHCTFDAIAEWKARHKAARIDPDTIKLLKDGLLRVPLHMEEHMVDDA